MVTSGSAYSNTWNYNNRITQTIAGSSTLAYTYDPTGQRLTYAVGTSTTTVYPSMYYNTDGTTTIKHLFANGTEIGTVTGTGASSTPHYVATDHLLGSSITTSASSTREEMVDYFPFGSMRLNEKAGTYTDQRKYAGSEYDAESGLNYMNARYYEGSLGRFISQDPVFWELGQTKDGREALVNPQAMNSYSYAGNNPMVNRDPSGRMFGVDDAAGMAGGGLMGGAMYVGSSMLSQQPMTWGGFTGSIVSGGVVGWGIANAPETGGLSLGAALSARVGIAAAFGGAGGFTGNITKQLIDIKTGVQSSGSISELAASTGFGFLTGGITEGVLPNARIPMLSAGRGNWNSTGLGLQTKMSEGLIGGMSGVSAIKSAIGSQAAGAYKTLGGGVADTVRTLMGSSQQQNAKK